MRHRYTVNYGNPSGYVVYDNLEGTNVFASPSKSTVIAYAQRMNGYTPADGDEQTYGRQATKDEQSVNIHNGLIEEHGH